MFSFKKKKEDEENEVKIWEIFIRSKQGLHHKHVGSFQAKTAEEAMGHAQEVYMRKLDGASIWVVDSKNIYTSHPETGE